MNLQLFEEKVQPTGGSKAEGAKRILGTPSMGPLTVVLREAVQNSWDARVGDAVSFAMHYFKPKADQKAALMNGVFSAQPSKSRIREAISAEGFSVLVFSDRGTTGLNGPVRADAAVEPGQKRNFVEFVFEIGRDESKGIGGGTYGFGKSSFFSFSTVGTVCIHTRCLHNGRYEERFIAAHLGTSAPGKWTGRAWWARQGSGNPEPILGPAAAQVAAAVGMPPFAGNECGTSIMVLAPRVAPGGDNRPMEEQVTPKDVIRSLGSSFVQWFWPKMIPRKQGTPEISFQITYEAQSIPVPSPADCAPFGTYVEALNAIEEFRRTRAQPAAGRVVEVRSERPVALLGHLCLLRRVKKPRIQAAADFEEDSAKELSNQAHHVALLREPRLVVKYLAGPKPPSEMLDISGVFLVDERSLDGEVEKAFSLSEPPVHDDWVSAALDNRHHKIYVNGALRRIKEQMGEFTMPNGENGGVEAPQPGLGAFSEMLGGLLAESCLGPGARVQPVGGGAGGGGGGRGVKIAITGSPELQLHPRFGRVLAVSFRVEAAPSTKVTLRAKAAVVLDGGLEREPPNGAESAAVKALVFHPDGGAKAQEHLGDSVDLKTPSAGRWTALAFVPPDAKVRVSVTGE